MQATRRSTPVCPVCSSGENVVRLVYGYPDQELAASAARDEVALGRCCVDPGNPRWYCNSCRTSFGRPWGRPAFSNADEEDL